MLSENSIQCQAIKENRMQCQNPAIVRVNGIPFCRLDLNYMVGQGLKNSLDLGDSKLELINEEDKLEVDKIISGGSTNADSDNSKNSEVKA